MILASSGNYASVNQQSGIKAGDGGFQVTVKGNTDLKGGIISSSDQAIADNTNTLATATLTQSELANRADANVETSGFNVSSDMFSQGKYGLAKGGLGNILKNDNMSSHSTGNTRSAISAGAITLTNEAKTGVRSCNQAICHASLNTWHVLSESNWLVVFIM